MDRNGVFGGNPLGVLIRLVLLSIVVGVVLSALGITPGNLFYHLNVLARRIYDMGFGAIEWLCSISCSARSSCSRSGSCRGCSPPRAAARTIRTAEVSRFTSPLAFPEAAAVPWLSGILPGR